jgi:adenosine deaminase
MNGPFISGIPKIELHVHIEGTMTPELRWNFGQRTTFLYNPEAESNLPDFGATERDVQSPANQISAFFDAYYGGMEVLRAEEDFYELTMDYFIKATAMNVRYCEHFFDPQAHTRRRAEFDTFMTGFKRTQIDVERDLNVMQHHPIVHPELTAGKSNP